MKGNYKLRVSLIVLKKEDCIALKTTEYDVKSRDVRKSNEGYELKSTT